MIRVVSGKTEESLSASISNLKYEQTQDKVPKHTDIFLILLLVVQHLGRS
jgi:hypothetical protein